MTLHPPVREQRWSGRVRSWWNGCLVVGFAAIVLGAAWNLLRSEFREESLWSVLVLGVAGFLTYRYGVALFRARVVRVVDGELFIDGPAGFSTFARNVGIVAYDGEGLALQMFDPFGVAFAPTIDQSARRAVFAIFRANREKHGCDLFVPGFSAHQTAEIREALGLAPPVARGTAQKYEQYFGGLDRISSRAWVTPVIIALNLIVYGAMIASGEDPLSPGGGVLFLWGANYAPFTVAGQHWRLLTCVFLHFGAFHLAMNMWALSIDGPTVERRIGSVGFALLYLACGVGASVASAWWMTKGGTDLLHAGISAGASGAVYGVYGALATLFLIRRHEVPLAMFEQMRSSAGSFVMASVVFGFMNPQIDHAAHIGGLVLGLAFGWILLQPIASSTVWSRTQRNTAIAILGAVLIVGTYAALVFAASRQLPLP